MDNCTNSRILLFLLLASSAFLTLLTIFKLDVASTQFYTAAKLVQVDAVVRFHGNGGVIKGTNYSTETEQANARSSKQQDFLQGYLIEEQKFIRNMETHLKSLPSESGSTLILEGILKRSTAKSRAWWSDGKVGIHDRQFIDYMKCPTSLRWKMLLDRYTKRKFVPETPILAWNEHFSRDEYARLSRFHGIFGWKDLKEKEIASALTAFNSSRSKYLFDDRMISGKTPNNISCIKCAVIGNGGILKGSKKGKEIDAHNYIFRVNSAITKGFEEDVGTRTSFYCFGIITLSNTLAEGLSTGFLQLPNDKGIRYIFFADNPWAYAFLAAALNGKSLPLSSDGRGRLPPKFPKKLTANDVKLVHPDFQRYLKYNWVNSSQRDLLIHRPTTGGIMLLLAIHTCDEVSAYGFAGSYDEYSDHYYDKIFKKHKTFLNHDNQAENELWKELDKRRIIRLYTRENTEKSEA